MVSTTGVLMILAGLVIGAFAVHEYIFGPKGEGLIDAVIKFRIRRRS